MSCAIALVVWGIVCCVVGGAIGHCVGFAQGIEAMILPEEFDGI